VDAPGQETGRTDRARLRALAGLGVAATAVWVSFAVGMTGRGFGGGNEGFYLLSYEHWRTNARTFSMVQYFYGPVFDLLGHDVALLRLFRVVTILLAHVLFGWHFMGWLATVRSWGSTGRLRRVAGVSAITASGGIVYGWLPATPGYNDVTILGSMCLLACVFRLQVRREAGRGPGPLGCAAFGAVAVVMVLTKATMVPGVLVATAAMCAAVASRRGRLIVLGWLALGSALALLALDILVKPLDETLPPLVDTLTVVAGSAHGPVDLARASGTSVSEAVGLGAIAFTLPGLALMLAVRRRPGRIADLAPWIAIGLNLLLVGLAGGLHGGLDHVGAYQAGIVAMLLTGIAAAAWGGTDRRGVGLLMLVMLMPLLGAFGTNNPLVAVAVGGSGMWVAALVQLLTGIDPGRHREQKLLAGLATGGAVIICVCVAVTGVTHGRHGESLIAGGARHVEGVPVLASVEVPGETADRFAALRDSLTSYVEPAGRPMIAFGELSDLVVVLNGRPVGNAWFSAGEDGLQAADLRAACAHGNPWRRQPLILRVRELTAGERAGFAACGLDLGRDYVELTPEVSRPDLRALVPASEVAGR
jgi:hypothetical protein